MLTEAIILLVLLLLIAAFVKGGAAFAILYLLLGVYAASLIWSRQATRHITFKRAFEKRIFWGEPITVRLEISNHGRLPIPWMHLTESLPVELGSGVSFSQIVSLKPREKVEIPYTLSAFKRGYYRLGPFTAEFGDTLGLTSTLKLNREAEHITVYPRVYPIVNLKLPSHSPQGTLRHNQPIFEDTARLRGKRGYQSGDSLRRIDWKATAASGQLQVKLFEPSIALQTVLFLNLNKSDYPGNRQIDATELSISIAASLANWVTAQKQSVGLVTNGADALTGNRSIQPLLPRKGRGQLIHILDLLARIQSTETSPFTAMLREETSRLSWGTTVVVITGQADEALFDELFHIKRQGQDVVLVLSGLAPHLQQNRQRAKQFDIPIYDFPTEKSLESWRVK